MAVNPNDGRQLIGYHVIDVVHQDIGPVVAVWCDEWGGDAEFIGVRAGISHAVRLIPLQTAAVEAGEKIIRVPYAHDQISATNHFHVGDTLDAHQRWEIFDEYGLERPDDPRSDDPTQQRRSIPVTTWG